MSDGDGCLFGCATIFYGGALLGVVVDEDVSPEGRGLAAFLLVAGLATIFLYKRWSSRKREREDEIAESRRGLADARRNELAARARRLCGENRLLAICEGHPKLLRPVLCLLTIEDRTLRIDGLSLELQRGEDLLNTVSSLDIHDTKTALEIVFPFDEIVEISRVEIESRVHVPGDNKIKRAVVGGVLAGEAGAVVGAISGKDAAFRTDTEGGRKHRVRLETGVELIIDPPDSYVRDFVGPRATGSWVDDLQTTCWSAVTGEFMEQLTDSVMASRMHGPGQDQEPPSA